MKQERDCMQCEETFTTETNEDVCDNCKKMYDSARPSNLELLAIQGIERRRFMVCIDEPVICDWRALVTEGFFSEDSGNDVSPSTVLAMQIDHVHYFGGGAAGEKDIRRLADATDKPICPACKIEPRSPLSQFCPVCASLTPQERAATQPEIDRIVRNNSPESGFARVSALLAILIISCAMLAGCAARGAQQSAALALPTPETSASRKPAYYCGAITKAGTPCKHRVKNQGDHCWQHQTSR